MMEVGTAERRRANRVGPGALGAAPASNGDGGKQVPSAVAAVQSGSVGPVATLAARLGALPAIRGSPRRKASIARAPAVFQPIDGDDSEDEGVNGGTGFSAWPGGAGDGGGRGASPTRATLVAAARALRRGVSGQFVGEASGAAVAVAVKQVEEQQGPYQAGRSALHRGRIVYSPCRTPVWPPSDWDGSLAVRSARLPRAGLDLEWVYGYGGAEGTAPNAFYNAQGRVVYPVASLGVVYDPSTHTQEFFRGHGGPIRCLEMHPERRLVATSEADDGSQPPAPADPDSGDPAPNPRRVCVWNSAVSPPALVAALDLPPPGRADSPGGDAGGGALALAFSPAPGAHLAVAVGPLVAVYHWRSGALLAQGAAHGGAAPLIRGIAFNPFFAEERGGNGDGGISGDGGGSDGDDEAASGSSGSDAGGSCVTVDRRLRAVRCDEDPPLQFATWGTRHVRLWIITRDKTGQQRHRTAAGRFGRADREDITAAAFTRAGWLVTGTAGGRLLQWDASERRGALGCCVRAVRALALRSDGCELVSAGDDGRLVVWGVTPDGVGRATASMRFDDPAEPHPVSFRALDFRPPPTGGACSSSPGGPDPGAPVLIGTACELWEIPGAALSASARGAGSHSDLGGNGGGGGSGRAVAGHVLSAALGEAYGASEDGGGGRGGSLGGRSDLVWAGPGGGGGGSGGSLLQAALGAAAARSQASGLQGPPEGALLPRPLVQGHGANGCCVAWHPLRPHRFATACDGPSVYVWHARRRALLAKVPVGSPARCVAFSSDGAHLAVGTTSGVVLALSARDLTHTEAEMKQGCDGIEVLRYSPRGSYLAAGGGNGVVVVYDAADGYRPVSRCPPAGTGAVTAIDWSQDGTLLLVGCEGQELAVFDAATGKKIARAHTTRDVPWATVTNLLGFSVMGVWHPGSAWGDLLSLDRSSTTPPPDSSDPLTEDGPLVATAGRDGALRLLCHPCVVGGAPAREYRGHVSAVAACRFSPNNRWLMSLGSTDRTMFQWRVLPNLRPERRRPSAASGAASPRPSPAAAGTTPAAVMGSPRAAGGPQAGSGGAEGFAFRGVFGGGGGGGPSGLGQRESSGGAGMSGGGSGGMAGPLGSSPTATPAAASLVAYTVSTLTSDMRGAGTDCGVTAVIYGASGDSGEVTLDNHPDNFARGRYDTFVVTAPRDLGPIARLRIGHDGRGSRPRWHLAHATVSRVGSTDPPALFPCGLWFASDEGDGRRVRLLQRDRSATAARGPSGGFFGTAALGSVVAQRYRVTVVTSDEKGASTDAGVGLVLIGSAGSSGPHTLENGSDSAFKRGAVDEFSVVAAVGELRAVRVGHDNTGPDPAWRLQEVRVQCLGPVISGPSPGGSPGPEVVFPADRWLAADRGDGQTWVTLTPAQPPEAPATAAGRSSGGGAPAGMPLPSLLATSTPPLLAAAGPPAHPAAICSTASHMYKLVVRTQDSRGAGHPGPVTVVLVGDRGCSPELALDGAGDAFARGGCTEFIVDAGPCDIGQLVGLDVGVPPAPRPRSSLGGALAGLAGGGAGRWGLASVEVTRLADGERTVFPHSGWVSGRDTNGGSGPGAGASGGGGAQRPGLLRLRPAGGRLAASDGGAAGGSGGRAASYRVTVRTGGVVDDGSDGGAEDSGPPSGVVLTLHGTGAAAPDDGGIRAATSGPLRLDGGEFRPGCADSFTFQRLRDLGSLTSATLTLEGSHQGGRWLLESLEVADLARGTVEVFPFGRWLDFPTDPHASLQQTLLPQATTGVAEGAFGSLNPTGGGASEASGPGGGPQRHGATAGPSRLSLASGRGPAPLLRYEVAVVTSADVRGAGAGPEGFVALNLEGTGGASGWTRLEAGPANFQRGCRDVFYLTAPDLGALTEVGVRRDTGGSSGGAGGAPRGWHLHSVEVLHPGLHRRFVFPWRRWLRGLASEAVLTCADLLPQSGTVGGLTAAAALVGSAAVGPPGAPLPGGAVLQWPAGPGGTAPHLTGPGPMAPAVQVPPPLVRGGVAGGWPGGNAAYKVTVATADVDQSGANGPVGLVVYGESGNTGELRLEGGPPDFARGQVSTFTVLARDVGRPVSLRVVHGGSPWCVEEVEVVHEPTGSAAWFRHTDGWVGADAGPSILLLPVADDDDEDGWEEDEGEEEGEEEVGGPEAEHWEADGTHPGKAAAAAASGPGNSSAPQWHQYQQPYEYSQGQELCEQLAPGQARYVVAVLMQLRPGLERPPPPAAERGADVSIALAGEEGSTGPLQLGPCVGEAPDGAWVFNIEGPDVGRITAANLELHAGEVEEAWRVGGVEVTHSATGQSVRFAFVGWVDSDDAEAAAAEAVRQQQERAQREQEAAAVAGQSLLQQQQGEQQGEQQQQQQRRRRRQDAAVEAHRLRDLEEHHQHQQQQEEEGRRQHHQQQQEEEQRRSAALQARKQQQEEERRRAQEQRRRRDASMQQQQHQQQRRASRPVGSSGLRDYEIAVSTGAAPGASTECEVWLRLEGEEGATGEVRLERACCVGTIDARGRSHTRAPLFERGATDLFRFPGPDVGTLRRVAVRIAPRGALGTSWLLDKVRVRTGGTTFKFVHGGWLACGDDGSGARVVLEEQHLAQSTAQPPGPDQEDMVRYRVGISTTNVPDGGTDAPVMIQVVGPHGLLGRGAIHLENSTRRFERDCLDEFWLELPLSTDCGAPIQRLTVERGGDPSDPSLAWHLDSVTIEDMDRGLTYIWRCGGWLGGRGVVVRVWDAAAAARGERQGLELMRSVGVERGAPLEGKPTPGGSARAPARQSARV